MSKTIAVTHSFWLFATTLLLTSCAQYQDYEAAPLDTDQFIQTYLQRDLNNPVLDAYFVEKNYSPSAQWDLKGLTLVGLFYSPQLMVAQSQVKQAEARLISAGVKPSPELELSLEHHQDQPDGVSPFTIGSIFTWVYEPKIKREARFKQARANIDAAKIESKMIEWQVYDGVFDNYLESYDAARKLTLREQALENISETIQSLERSAELGLGADFEISRSRLDLQQMRLSRSEEKGQYRQAITRLALTLGVPAQDIDAATLSYQELQTLPDLNSTDLQLEYLQTRALTRRPDILKALADYAVIEADLHNAIAEQYPDIRLSPGFIFDQDDQIWLIGSAFNLPFNHPQRGPIAEAEAARTTQAHRFHALQARVINEVNEALIQYQTAIETLHEADQLLAELDAHRAKIQRQYDLGYTSKLSLLRDKQQHFSALVSRHAIEMNAWRAFAAIEDALMTPILSPP